MDADDEFEALGDDLEGIADILNGNGHGGASVEYVSPSIRILKPLHRANKLSKRLRIMRVLPKEQVELRRLIPLSIAVNNIVMAAACVGVMDPELFDLSTLLKREVAMRLTFPVSRVPRQPKLSPVFVSIDAAYEKLGETDFYHFFGLHPQEAKELSGLLFDEAFFVINKQGNIPREEALLSVCARLRLGMRNYRTLQFLFGRREEFMCTSVKELFGTLFERWGPLLRLDKMWRFNIYAGDWRGAFARKYEEKSKGFLVPNEFALVNAAIDCVHHRIARPSPREEAPNVQEAFYQGWKGIHSVKTLTVNSVDGMFLGASEVTSGKVHDHRIFNEEDVGLYMGIANLHAIADKGFTSSANLSALPKVNNQHTTITPAQQSILADLRTAIAEWPYGQLKQGFPLLIDWQKQKMFQTCPTHVLIVAMLITNLTRLYRGCNNTTYFDLAPRMTPKEYLSMPLTEV
jgi:DDE superfamily endonuclease